MSALNRPVVYFVRRIESFQRDGIEPPRHMRVELKCDSCSEKCWANRDNYLERDKRYIHKVICDVCFALGRYRTG